MGKVCKDILRDSIFRQCILVTSFSFLLTRDFSLLAVDVLDTTFLKSSKFYSKFSKYENKPFLLSQVTKVKKLRISLFIFVMLYYRKYIQFTIKHLAIGIL